MVEWKLWSKGEVIRKVTGIEPQLASWERKDHPSQIRLNAYLDELFSQLGPLPSLSGMLYLHMTVDVEHDERLLHHYDLENYLTPIFEGNRLDAKEFRLVSAKKRVGGGSEILVGLSLPTSAPGEAAGWGHFSYSIQEKTSQKAWKPNLRDALANSNPSVLLPGPVKVQLAWRCSVKRRNWRNLWKPTGDTMGPVLGESSSKQPFNPRDDRIVSLDLHVNPDNSMKNSFNVGMWWASGE